MTDDQIIERIHQIDSDVVGVAVVRDGKGISIAVSYAADARDLAGPITLERQATRARSISAVLTHDGLCDLTSVSVAT